MLWPARVACAPAYWLGLKAHQGIYRSGIKKRYRPPAPVVCIGNISLGGTGKTPLVISIVKMLQESGRKVGVLIRGYKSSGAAMAIAKGRELRRSDQTTLTQIGDEAFLLTTKLAGADILIGPDRTASARTAVDELGCDVLVMDDGFQHWALERDLDIVAVDASQPAGLDHLLPWGALREGFGALRRADVAVITKARSTSERERTADAIRRANRSIEIWHADFVPREILRLGDGKRISGDSLAGQPVIIACAIASPQGFEQTALSLGCRIEKRFFYRDHFSYPDLVIRYLEIQAQKVGARWLLTTEKDAVKLRGRISPSAPWAAVAVETNWLEPAEKQVRSFLQTNLLGRGACDRSDHKGSAGILPARNARLPAESRKQSRARCPRSPISQAPPAGPEQKTV